MAGVATKTKTVDGKDLPAEKFAYVGDPDDLSTWHLPIDSDHIGSALKMFGHEQHVPDAKKGAVARKIASTAKSAGLDTKDFESKYCGTSGSADHADASGWVEIFRAGDYRPQGKGLVTRDDLDRVVRNYDPTYHEAPITVGHPADNLPAFGWIDRLAVQGDVLLAKEREVDPQFNELRQAGRYKKRSASFYTDAEGKVNGLRHVGYLGAQPPAVKGLQDVKFQDNGREFIEVNFGEESAVADKSVPDQIREFFAGVFNPGASKTFSEDDVRRIAGESAANAAKAFDVKIVELQGKLDKQASDFAERERKIAGGETAQRATEAVNRLKGAGRWIPAYDKAGVPLVFAELAKLNVTVEFGEGAEKKATAPFDLLVNFLEGLPAIVPGGRLVNTGASNRIARNSTGDPFTDAVKARQKEKNITFAEAMEQVKTEQPELMQAGRFTSGAV